MSDDMNALETRMEALQQEMDTIQNQLDFHLKTSPSIDMTTRTSIDHQQAPAENQQQSIDSNNCASIYTSIPAQYNSMKEEILNTIKTDNKWEEQALKEKLDVFYCSLNSNINWVAKRDELMQKRIGFAPQQAEAVTIDRHRRHHIDRYGDKRAQWMEYRIPLQTKVWS